jgi:hypothetical protein
MAVGETVATTNPTPIAQQPSAADTYFIPAIAGIFVLLIIVLAVVVLSMRKRP